MTATVLIHTRRKVKVIVVRFQGSVIREQGVIFGILVVKPSVLHSENERESAQVFGLRAFGNMPIVLMCQDSRGIPTYYGRNDIVRFLSNISPRRIPWKEYSIA